MSIRRLAAAAFAVTLGCATTPSQPVWDEPEPVATSTGPELPAAPDRDVHTYAHAEQVASKHIGLSWKVDFAKRELSGHVTHAIERRDTAAPLRLDTRGIEVERVQTSAMDPGGQPRLAELAESAGWQDATWAWGQDDPILGRELVVTLPDDAKLVRVHYRTTPGASGLQWLEPSQTAGTQPFLYSQSQAIHARSFIPCQDSPGVRITYDATIEIDRPLVAAMAGRRVDASGAKVDPGALPKDGRHRFDMREPIPAYLLAVAVGDLKFRGLGHRTGVWAEPATLDRAANEFSDVEAMMRTAETLYGPYRWERYDLLVLPPAFPFGGMENPRLTFVTPTILAGDRSLTSLVAHELAHSWSGNLVTNATWGDMWLNEGFTVYIERRIVEALYGEDRAVMEAVLGLQDLQAELDRVEPADERLEVDLLGRDPDEAMTDVAYEKGALLLRQLERTYGREIFDPFLRDWFDRHAFTSVRTSAFEAFLREQLLEAEQPRLGAKIVDARAWIHRPGVPDGASLPQSDAFTKVDAQVEAFAAGKVKADALPGSSWTPYQWLHFLRHLPEDLTVERMATLDAAYALTKSNNYEILAQWLETAIGRNYRASDERLETFLVDVGRRKFLVPLYEALVAAGRDEDAKRIYARARSGYHTITRDTLDELLGKPG